MNINWDEAPEGFDYALTTASDWNGAPEYRGTVLFVKKTENSTYFECSDGTYPCVGRGCWEVVATRPKQWNGAGLPPVGTVCEVRADHIREGDWTEVKVLALGLHAKDVAVLVAEHSDGIVGKMHCLLYSGFEDHFRPIKTKEQIAAEERESEVSHIERCITNLKVEHQNNPRVIAEVLHNIGYRKQENTNEQA